MVTVKSLEILFIKETYGCHPILMLGIPGKSVLKSHFSRVRSSILQAQKLNFVHLSKVTHVLEDFHAHGLVRP